MSSEERGRASYLDLLITTLMEHEKNLDSLVERLERLCENFQNTYEGASAKAKEPAALKEKGETIPPEQDTVVYMKLKLRREIDEAVKIIESLKE